jgi:phenylacetate-CoA ligase
MNTVLISLIAPCLNEEGNVQKLSERFFTEANHRNMNCEIVFIDDGSTDHTWDRIEGEVQNNPGKIQGLRHNSNQGIPKSWISGVEVARGKYVCLIDSDLQNRPESVFDLYDALVANGASIVRGIRRPTTSASFGRVLMSKGLNFLLNTIFGMKSRDNKSGFLLGERNLMSKVVHHRGHYHHFQTFIGVSANLLAPHVLEIDTPFDERSAGKSFLSGKTLRVACRAIADIPEARREYAKKGSESVARYQGLRKLRFEAYFALMPLHAWMIRGRQTRRRYFDLKESEYFSREELNTLQNLRLRTIVQHAYDTSLFYRERLDGSGIKPSDIQSVEDLSKLPFLEKEDVRQNLHSGLISDAIDKNHMLQINTSGSTGKPFTIFADRDQLEIRFASTLRALEWTGWRFGDRQARLWHQTIGMSLTQVVRERIDAWFMRRMFIPAFEINDKNIEAFVEKIRRFRPKLVDGYAESLNFLARYIQMGKLVGFNPVAVVSSAQALPIQTRTVIEEGMATKVFDKYGSREFSGIAYECTAHIGHHVVEECYIVEVLVGNRVAMPGEVGEIVITDLHNRATPMIRYRIGDIATAIDNSVNCPCGRSHFRIGDIEGRTQAIVYCANGTWMPGTFFMHFFKDHYSVIEQFQIFQEEKECFTLKVIRGKEFSEEAFEKILFDLQTYVGMSKIDIEYVEEIPLVRTGKRSPVVSLVNEDFQNLVTKNKVVPGAAK